MNPFKPISISLSPNTEPDDIRLALKLLFQPWRWTAEAKSQQLESLSDLEREFRRYLGVKCAFSFNSGRSALMAILNSLNLEKGSEVLLQAFTCNAAANPIIWSGFKPVYVDCDEKTFNMDSEDLKRKISAKSKVVMVQHTFGLPADMDEIVNICQQNNLILIEDCAHALGATYKGKNVGTFGRASFFSFSRDKVISSVYGGMSVTDDLTLAQNIKNYQGKAGFPSFFWTFQQLLHPILMNWVILPTYKIFGKYLLILLQWFHILSKAVHWKEKRGLRPGYFPKKLPSALSLLALNQLGKLEKLNDHRKEVADFYFFSLKDGSLSLPLVLNDRENIFLRFTVKHPQAHRIIERAWRENLLIGDWYTSPVAPHDTKLDKLQYVSGSCPKAEKLSKETFNLPTHINISQKEVKRILDFLKKHVEG
ncbi:MAG: aminotransferase class I/II-fold pyridoxal phosphate-dependent enzyme [Candidatus Pacebacteria bacterium]|nr:aminotransferase class I/II-fold pyridoxal phosphate-dependent enzyme [Candidatus Paceibacterota bacterium]